MKELYYLLYQVKNSNINWIVDVNIELTDEFINIINYISKQEIYKIYKRYISTRWIDIELNYKQFRIFNIEKNDKLIYISRY